MLIYMLDLCTNKTDEPSCMLGTLNIRYSANCAKQSTPSYIAFLFSSPTYYFKIYFIFIHMYCVYVCRLISMQVPTGARRRCHIP